MRVNLLTLFIGITLFITSCDEQESYLPAIVGKVGDVVVIGPDELLNSSAMTVIDTILGRDVIGLPRPEPKFKVGSVSEEGFTKSIQNHRNIIRLNFDYSDEGGIRVKRNTYANQQVLFEVKGRNVQEVTEVLLAGLADIERKIELTEMVRLRDRNKTLGPTQLGNDLHARRGIRLDFQKGFKLDSELNEVLWYRRDVLSNAGGEQHQISQGILVYEQPYLDTLDLEPISLIALKDSVTKMMIHGAVDSSYMTTSPFSEPRIQIMDWMGKYAVEIQGLWRMERGAMGGPYMLYSIHDEQHQRIVHLLGYVYAPQFEKRPFLMEVEAIIKSIEFNS